MVLVIIQARMLSTRLPGKVMREVAGQPLIGHLLDRLALSKKADQIVVATSEDASNDVLCDYVCTKGIEIFRGNEEDVLSRYYQAALNYKPQTIVRITADCPLMDPVVVDGVIEYFQTNEFDYVSNIFPRTYPDGMDVEVFSFDALTTTYNDARSPEQREHVTIYMRESGIFKVGCLISDQDHSRDRITVDYEDDIIVVENILDRLGRDGKYFSMNDILRFKTENPEVFERNAHLVVK